MGNVSSNKSKKYQQYWAVVAGFIAGIIGGVITWFCTDTIAINQELKTYCEVIVDDNNFRQGDAAIRWDFDLQPKRKYLFSKTKIVCGSLHIEVRCNDSGHIQGLNLNDIFGLKLYIKSSSENFIISEANLFVGENFIQYIYEKPKDLLIGTKWREMYLPFQSFKLAPWDKKYRLHLVTSDRLDFAPDVSNITAIGFDLKTSKLPLSGKIWIDYIRFVNNNGMEILYSDADTKKFDFQNKHLSWICDWKILGRFE